VVPVEPDFASQILLIWQKNLDFMELLNIASKYESQGQYPLAVVAYQTWLNRNQTIYDHIVYFNLGVALSIESDLQGAEDAFRLAVRLSPSFLQPHINLGLILERQGDMEGALAEWRKVDQLALTEFPDQTALNIHALNHLGRVLACIERYSEANAYFKKSHMLEPVQPEVAQAIVNCQARIDRQAGMLVEQSLPLQAGVPNPGSNRLEIFDDYFPVLMSAFRVAEFNGYFRAIPESAAYSYHPYFENAHIEYSKTYPGLGGRVNSIVARKQRSSVLAYSLFLNNAFNMLVPSSMPFIFTLYPGGGFWRDHQESHRKLDSVFSSPNLRKVIVTTPVARRYLLDRHYCTEELIEYIYGAVLPIDHYEQCTSPKKKYQENKATFDVCFVAHKYTKQGVDKGYDTFIAVARILAPLLPDIRFHVVGPWTPSDVDLASIANRVRFYGPQVTSFFVDFYSQMDVILSPNKSGLMYPGSFDGFPTGCCVEAGASGVAVFCTDDLGQNECFEEGIEIVIIPTDPVVISQTILNYIDDLDALYRLSERGRAAILRIYNIDAQMNPRLKVLTEWMR